MSVIKESRLEKKLTQKQATETLGISLRSYNWEIKDIWKLLKCDICVVHDIMMMETKNFA